MIDRDVQVATVFMVLGLVASACGGNLIGSGATTTNQALEAIDSAINALNANSAAWQATLTGLEAQLNHDAQSLIANEVTNLIQRGVGTAGVELRCNADFVGNRMKAALQAIAAKLRNGPLPSAPPPAVCQVSPTTLDMANRPREVDFFGYDFDRGDVRLFLTHAGGEIAIDSAVSRPTHYLMTVDVSQGTLAPLCNLENRRLVLRSGGVELSSVSVIRKQCPAAPPPPPPLPRKVLLDKNESCAGGLFGCRDDRRLGGVCTAGYHREQCLVTKLGGGGHCEQKAWASDDEHDCTCVVHFGAPAAQGVDCRVTISELGDPRPAPPPPPCACW